MSAHLDLTGRLSEELGGLALRHDRQEVGLGEVPVAVRHAGRDVGYPAGRDHVRFAVDDHLELAVEHHVHLLPRVAVRGRAGVGGAAGVEDLQRRPHGVGEQRPQGLTQDEQVVARVDGGDSAGHDSPLDR